MKISCSSALTLCIVLCLILIVGCSAGENATPKLDYSNMDIAEVFTTLEELTNSSELIVEVKLTGEPEFIEYEGANFSLTNAEVKEVLKGQVTNNSIKIFEVKAFNMNRTKKSDNFVLFMDKYKGPVTSEEAYVISGVYQGKFNVDNENKVIYDGIEYNGEVSFQQDLHLMNAEDFKKLVKERVDNLN
ncbi:hypothetical protein [Paenibacillus montanisoli]|uniref:Uncharacterized protein n=1 Tax=Paenibacillus montanisoli TaxID=2081970 RepID=A0A328U7T7_9BACL|nr:hypothetical protein [Paenibacillus montanisoli]RAP76116.1 hypothetical protein DL346_11905 [Paenibacillus montanisoli]